jgi:hypothetical protein
MSVGVGMSMGSGREVGMCLSIMFGIMAIVMGLMFTFIFSTLNQIYQIFSSVLLYSGILLLLVGVALIPGQRRKSAITRSILKIAAVRKEVTISEISQETGLDSEVIREVLTQYLIRGFLFGYIEGDLFVRDTAGRPTYLRGQRGLFEVGE